MSPSPGNVPRTPDRKSSSSTLLDAFRILTSGRPKSTSQAAVHPPALTPVQSVFSKGDVTKVDEVARKLSGNGSSSTGDTAGTDDSAAALPSLTNVVGIGAPELTTLIPQLDKSLPVAQRIAVAQKISAILDDFRVSNSLAIWATGQDLLLHDSSNVSRVAHTLLVSCVKCSDLSAFERACFFESIQPLDDDRHIDLRIQALVEVTSNGRNVESLELVLAPYLIRLLQTNFEVVTSHRKREKNPKSDTTIAEEQSFANLFQFIVDVIKFNAKAFQESDFNLLLDEVIAICKRTTHEADIVSATNVINALMTYTRVSIESIRPCVELLSDIFRQLGTLRKPTWAALSNILRSHLGPSAVQYLLEILQSAHTKDAKPNNTVRGAMVSLAQLFKKNGKEGLPEVPLMQLLPATRSALMGGDRKLAVDVITMFAGMLESEVLLEKLKEQLEWGDFVDAILTCSKVLKLSAAGQNETSNAKIADPPTIKSPKDLDLPSASTAFKEVISRLTAAFPELDLIHKESVVYLFLQLGLKLSDDAAQLLIAHCAEDRLVYPSNSHWPDNCRELVRTYLHDQSRSSHLRVLVANILREVYTTVEVLSEQSASEFALLALQKMSDEQDAVVLEALSSFAVTLVSGASDALFDSILGIFRTTVFQKRNSVLPSQNMSPTLSALSVGFAPQSQPSLCRVASKHVVRMFIGNANRSADKAEKLFSFILDVAGSSDCAIDARICAVKLIFRLRATSDYAIYIRPLSESESIAAVLCRTAETAQWIQTDESSSRDGRNVSSGSMQSKQKPFNVKKPVPPLWFYPGPKGLPEEPPHEPSPCLFSYIDPSIESTEEKRTALKMTYWLEKVIDLLQQPETDWEIYSYVVVHLGAQISNQNLFKGAIPQIKFLRNVLCTQIRNSTIREPPSYTSLKKGDVAVCILHILTILVSYHEHFAKSEEDDVVRAFIAGIGHWDRTSKWSIHALTVCCHEMPLSVSKLLDNVIQKMSTIITQSQIAIHILEFLVMLARLPQLYKNFREDEFKMVFGVSFRYLQYVHDKTEKESSASLQPRTGRAAMRHSDSFRELKMLSDSDARPSMRSPQDDLPQYVYALAFHVITFWFMNLKLQDRPIYMGWIAKNLTWQDRSGKDVNSDQGLVTMDMMDRVAYSDRDETAADPHFAKETDGEISQRTWIVGYSLLTIETAGRTGLSQLTRRRPSGTKYFSYRPTLTSPPRHQVPLTTGLAADAFYTSSYIGVLPEDVLQEYYSSFTLADPKSERPIALPEEEAVKRAISAFDRNSTVDGHKVGVIYMAPGQVHETDILANIRGSADYTSFIDELGFLTRLKSAQFNTQGLDRGNDTDGKYTYCWRDRATEIVFHITTMMPTELENDPRSTKKKSHIGNDFVNIVWNDSGEAFKFDTFPSAFNYVYIIITPEVTHSFADMRKDRHQQTFYKVQVLSAPGFPEISPAAETKVVSAKALPAFVRLVALNASVFSLVWANREGGEHFSPWRNRLREINRLREKYGGKKGSVGSSPVPGEVRPSSTLSASRERGVSSLVNRASLATFNSDNMSRSSLTPSSAGTDHGD
ncbi:hypothetical protein EJ08DRAFT_724972 [Tothia fuscella]|uniref:Rap-GAP domain-containing protein n=1 Tax=Tothia fuscella TaxID=1048955 RepID=A0A9P4TTQ9_9PEZI|nr:hypothetical protein EJ08DRAFT_724972 [Tothia fuscella]